MVAESILRIPLEDLKTIRIMCKKCGMTTEGPFNSTQNRIAITGQCGGCQHRFYDAKTGGANYLFDLMSNAEQLLQLASVLSVEFVIPDPDKA